MRVLFVCLGNICRSPLAEGVFRHVVTETGTVSRWTIESAGTGNWHVGEAPDPRAIRIAADHGIDISAQRARQVRREDFHAFDLILGMDHANVNQLTRMAAHDGTAEIDLFLAHATGDRRDVADPYFGDEAGFETAYRDIRAGAEALAAALAGTMSGERG